VGAGWTFDPFGAEISDGKIYGPRHLRYEGGLRGLNYRGGGLLSNNSRTLAGPSKSLARRMRNPAAMVPSPYLQNTGISTPTAWQHVIIPERAKRPYLSGSPRRLGGPRSKPRAKFAPRSMPFLGDCAVRHHGRGAVRVRKQAFPAMAPATPYMPVVPEGARSSTMNINSIHGGAKGKDADFDGLAAHCVPRQLPHSPSTAVSAESHWIRCAGEVRALWKGLRETRVDFDYELTRALNSVLRR